MTTLRAFKKILKNQINDLSNLLVKVNLLEKNLNKLIRHSDNSSDYCLALDQSNVPHLSVLIPSLPMGLTLETAIHYFKPILSDLHLTSTTPVLSDNNFYSIKASYKLHKITLKINKSNWNTILIYLG